jgi:hypothetical protein
LWQRYLERDKPNRHDEQPQSNYATNEHLIQASVAAFHKEYTTMHSATAAATVIRHSHPQRAIEGSHHAAANASASVHYWFVRFPARPDAGWKAGGSQDWLAHWGWEL